MIEEVLAGQTALLGPAHTDTLLTKGNLAGLLEEMGKRAEARRLLEEVVAGQTAQLGPAHTDTLNSKAGLAEVLVQQHELEAAAALIQPAIEALVRLKSPHRVLYVLSAEDVYLVLLLRRSHSAMTSVARSIHGELLSLGGDTSAARVELELALAAQSASAQRLPDCC